MHAGRQNFLRCWSALSQDQKKLDRLLAQIGAELQKMSQPDDMRDLPRDSEVPGLHYKLSSMLHSCCSCSKGRAKQSSAMHLQLV